MLAVEAPDPARGAFEPFAGERIAGAVRRFLKRDRRLRATGILSDRAESWTRRWTAPGMPGRV